MGIVKNPCGIIFSFSVGNHLNKKVELGRNQKHRNNLSRGSGKTVIVRLNFFLFQIVLLFMDLFMYPDYLTFKRIHMMSV